MSLKIIESCVNCFACEPVCPSKAIYETTPHFLIDPKKWRRQWLNYKPIDDYGSYTFLRKSWLRQ